MKFKNMHEKNKKRECVRLHVYLVLFATWIKFPGFKNNRLHMYIQHNKIDQNNEI